MNRRRTLRRGVVVFFSTTLIHAGCAGCSAITLNPNASSSEQASGNFVPAPDLTPWAASGASGYRYSYGAESVPWYAPSGEQCATNGINSLVVNAANDAMKVRDGQGHCQD